MDGNFVPLHKLKEGLLFLWSHKSISHNDDADVLHAIDAELWHENHIILLERERASEELLEKVYRYFDSIKSFIRFRQCSLCLSAIYLHRYSKPTFICDTAIWTDS